ncbi:hypothetical protein RB597_001547 [Gaeumannomyces tritici]
MASSKGAEKEAYTFGSVEYKDASELVVAMAAKIEQQEAQLTQFINKPQIAAKSYKFPTPDKYDGQEGRLKGFLTECKSYFLFYDKDFVTEERKVAYAATRLDGKVKDWFEPTWSDFLKGYDESKEETKIVFANFGKFSEELINVFGQVDEERVAERELLQLRQKGAASTYVSEFQRLVNKLDWTDQTKITHFYAGLRDDVKDEVSKIERPGNFSDYVTLAVRTSDRLYERRREKKGQGIRPVVHSNRANNRPNHNKSTAYGTHPGPMDLRAGSTHQQQQPPKRKFQNPKDGKCFKCGQPGHVKKDCPKQGKQVAATRKGTTEPKGNDCPGPTFSWTVCSKDSCSYHQSDKDGTGWYPRKRLAMTRKGARLTLDSDDEERVIFSPTESEKEEAVQAWPEREAGLTPAQEGPAFEELVQALGQEGITDSPVPSEESDWEDVRPAFQPLPLAERSNPGNQEDTTQSVTSSVAGPDRLAWKGKTQQQVSSDNLLHFTRTLRPPAKEVDQRDFWGFTEEGGPGQGCNHDHGNSRCDNCSGPAPPSSTFAWGGLRRSGGREPGRYPARPLPNRKVFKEHEKPWTRAQVSEAFWDVTLPEEVPSVLSHGATPANDDYGKPLSWFDNDQTVAYQGLSRERAYNQPWELRLNDHNSHPEDHPSLTISNQGHLWLFWAECRHHDCPIHLVSKLEHDFFPVRQGQLPRKKPRLAWQLPEWDIWKRHGKTALFRPSLEYPMLCITGVLEWSRCREVDCKIHMMQKAEAWQYGYRFPYQPDRLDEEEGELPTPMGERREWQTGPSTLWEQYVGPKSKN